MSRGGNKYVLRVPPGDIAEIASEFPEAVVQMDHDIAHLLAGEDFLLEVIERAGRRRLRASCLPYGPAVENRIDAIIEADKQYWESAHIEVPMHPARWDRETQRAHLPRFMARWLPDIGVWARHSTSLPIVPRRAEPRRYPTYENEPVLGAS